MGKPLDQCSPDASLGAGSAALERAARLFRALAEAPRLRILELLAKGELCVSDIVATLNEKFSTVSQRLRILRGEGLVERRREKTQFFYFLADRHVADLMNNALAHACELEQERSPAVSSPEEEVSRKRRSPMSTAHTHEGHTHQHGPNCGHTAIKHDGHVDYLHDGHLHHPTKGGAVEEHVLAEGGANPGTCTPKHHCGGHEAGHKHGSGCGHEAVPHGDHVDYLVDGHLHHPHGDHCDDHGKLARA